MKKGLIKTLIVAAAPLLALVPISAGAAAVPPLRDIKGMLSAEFGLTDITVSIDQQDVSQQSALDNAVGFEDAVRQAMKSFMENGADEESPLAILANIAWPENDPVILQNMLKTRLNKSGTVLTMLRIGDFPEYGESVRTHWVFRLKHDMSDHLNWAVVDRSGKKAAYNYGFN